MGCCTGLTPMKDMVLYTWCPKVQRRDKRRKYLFDRPSPTEEVLNECLIHYAKKYGTPEVLGIREEDSREWMKLDILYLKPPTGGFFIMSRASLSLAQKAQILADSSRIKQLDGETWEVPSLSSDRTYSVKWFGSGGTCTCKGFEYRNWCSHIEAVKMLAPPRERKEEPILDEL